MNTIPRLVIGGAHSGVGKSSVTLALVAALRRRGLRVQTFKVGPDYLDPGHLARVSERPCYNLDGWMSDEQYVKQLFNSACCDADIAIIEGVMGLFDGSSPSSVQGSTAQIADWLQAPVLLVVNAHGMARSIAPLVYGFNGFDASVQICGVIANMCGSESHSNILRKALESAQLPPLLGAIHRDDFPEIPSRHLGLVSAEETAWTEQFHQQLIDIAEKRIDLDRLRDALSAPEPKKANAEATDTAVPKDLRIAIARDAAFQFYYSDLFAALEHRGVEICFFSPLHDNTLPPGCDALYLGGGYPEIHAERLSDNSTMIHSIREFCRSGRPVYAECGGLIYLSLGVEREGASFPMVGELPCWTKMLPKRKALGYVIATLQRPTIFGDNGSELRGHEFHYSELCSDPIDQDGWQSAYRLKQNRSGKESDEGYQKGNILASYAHLHLASHPHALDSFVKQIMHCKRELS